MFPFRSTYFWCPLVLLGWVALETSWGVGQVKDVPPTQDGSSTKQADTKGHQDSGDSAAKNESGKESTDFQWTQFPQVEGQDEWRDLLSGQKLGGPAARWLVPEQHFFKEHGKVSLQDGVLQLASGTPGTGVVANFQVPRNEYEISFEVRRTEGQDFFCGMTFPFDEQQATLILGGWGGKTVGISNVNRFSAIENSTSRTVEFEDQRWYKVRLVVTPDAIECFLDDKSLFWLDPLDKKFETWWEQRPMEPLGFASWKSTGEIRKLRLRTVVSEQNP